MRLMPSQKTLSPATTARLGYIARTGLIVLLIAATIALAAHQYRLMQQLQTLQNAQQQSSDQLTSRLASTSQRLQTTQEEVSALANQQETQQEVLANLDRRMSNVDGQVSQIRKFQQTDPELLAKYSKTYFLNEHYTPSSLATIPETYRHPPDEEEEFHSLVWPKLRAMLEEAADDGVELQIVSAFRSFEEQQELKTHYNVVYGEDQANQFSAPQGYSEHQLGTTVDFTTPELGENFEQIDQTEGYDWLLRNAHEYGFILSYPEDNSYYQFEPWHWRYVGEELAQKLERENKHFYDLSQRTIDTYRDDFFD